MKMRFILIFWFLKSFVKTAVDVVLGSDTINVFCVCFFPVKILSDK